MRQDPTVGLRVELELPLDRFDLRVNLHLEHSCSGIFGPSGSGKTSLLESLAGLRRGARGRIALDGVPWLDSRRGVHVAAERRGIGWVPQEGLLFPHLDVRRNLTSGHRRSPADGQAMAFDTMVELLELAPLLDRAVTTLSGGERQRVALGRALSSAPRLLLLDEPLSSLDLPLRRRLLPLLRRVRDELTVPMVLISHDPIEVQALCDDLVVLQGGRVVARGAPRSVLTDPRVFSLADEESYENVVTGHWVGDDDTAPGAHGGWVELAPGVRLQTDRHGLSGGLSGAAASADEAREEVLVGLRASDILIATQRPQGISARNILSARLTELQPENGLLRVAVAESVPPLVVQVTQDTPHELGLRRGQEVFLVIKATACRVYGRDAVAEGSP